MSKQIDGKRTIVFIDASNYHYGLRKLGWDIDYEKFRDWLKRNFDVTDIYFYGGIHSEKSFFDSHPGYKAYADNVRYRLLKEYRDRKKQFFKLLRKLGYKVYEKLIGSIYDDTKAEYKLKCNCDVELTMDALLRINDYERFVLCSGDGDFARLVKYLKYMQKQVVVMSVADRTSWLLIKHANRLISLGKLRFEIELIRPKNAENPA